MRNHRRFGRAALEEEETHGEKSVCPDWEWMRVVREEGKHGQYIRRVSEVDS